MAAGSEAIIKALDARRKGMDERYGVVDPSFRDVAHWLDPARGRYLGQDENGDARKRAALIDSTPRKALRTVRAGLMSGLSSPARPWFILRASGYERPTHAMQVWLDECRRILFEVLAGSNAYASLMYAYGDLSLFGCFAGIARFSRENVVHVQSFPTGAYVWAESDEGGIDTLHWTMKMTVRQVVERYGLEAVSQRVKNQYEANNLNERVDICAAIEPRLTHDPMKPKYSRNMPVAVYYWEKGERSRLLHEGGLEAKSSIIGPRWETVIGDPWPVSSPGRDMLGDARQLQRQHIDRDTAVQAGYKPPMVGPVEASQFSYHPGAYNVLSVANMDKGRPVPIFQGQLNIQHLDAGIQATQSRVMEASFADLFRIASEYGVQGLKDVTATGIDQMRDEQLMVLGPVLESVDRGMLAPLVETAFHHCQQSGLLPPVPQDMDGVPVTVEFTGILFQAMRAIGIAPTERMIGFAGTVAGILGPDVLKNLDGDKIVREFGEQIGFSANGFREPDMVEAERKAEAEAMQQQQMMDAMPQAAQAASLLSEASARGEQGLSAMGVGL